MNENILKLQKIAFALVKAIKEKKSCKIPPLKVQELRLVFDLSKQIEQEYY